MTKHDILIEAHKLAQDFAQEAVRSLKHTKRVHSWPMLEGVLTKRLSEVITRFAFQIEASTGAPLMPVVTKGTLKLVEVVDRSIVKDVLHTMQKENPLLHKCVVNANESAECGHVAMAAAMMYLSLREQVIRDRCQDLKLEVK